MAYIGNTVQNQGFSPAVDYYNGDGTTVTFTLSRPVASVAQLTAVIENVIQNPATAFTVSGNSITFTSAPPAGTNNIWVEYTSLVTTYAAISQDPSVIGDITATGGYLAVGDFGNTYLDGTIVDYVTGNARITTGASDDMTFYHGGTASRSEMMTLYHAGGAKIYGTTALTIPVGTTAQRPVSPTVGMIRFNTTLNYIEEYRNGQWLAVSNVFTATGGTESISGGYKYHVFTSSGTFTVQAGIATVDYLVVAGGGGGGTFVGGGAGAGGVTTGSVSASVNSYTITIGAGAAAQSTNGSNSSFGALVTAIGGGAGGIDGASPGNGGSGGGGRFTFGTGTSGQGNNGASGLAAPAYQTGGGGGAGAAGDPGTSSGGGNGGAGRQLTDFAVAGSPAGYYGGGGGGGWANASFAGTGLGGIGGGGSANQSGNGGAGTANTGGGGGANASAGGSFTGVGGNGGSGIVIIRYPI